MPPPSFARRRAASPKFCFDDGSGTDDELLVVEQPRSLAHTNLSLSNTFMADLTYVGGLSQQDIETLSPTGRFNALADEDSRPLGCCQRFFCALSTASLVSLPFTMIGWVQLQAGDLAILRGQSRSSPYSIKGIRGVEASQLVAKASSAELKKGNILAGDGLKIFYLKPGESMVLQKGEKTLLCPSPGYYLIEDPTVDFVGSSRDARTAVDLQAQSELKLGEYEILSLKDGEFGNLEFTDSGTSKTVQLTGPGNFIRWHDRTTFTWVNRSERSIEAPALTQSARPF